MEHVRAPEYKRVFLNPELRKKMDRKVKTIIATIDASTFDDGVKTELKALVTTWKTAKDEEASCTRWMHDYKAGTNERQYARRIAEKMSNEKRSELQTNQFAYRNAFANSVFGVYQARLVLVKIAADIRSAIARIGTEGRNPLDRNALVAVMTVAYSCDNVDPRSVLKELDNVSDISRERILEAVCIIFEQKKAESGMMSKISFSSSELLLVDPTPEQLALQEALLPAIAVRQEFEDFWSAYTTAKSRYNLPQFTQRMEQAFADGDEAKVESIRSSRRDAEAEVFVTASNWVNAYPRMVAIREKLYAAIRAAAETIKETKSLEASIAMSHLIGCWHWHSELCGYIEDKYRQYDLENVLASLEFNAQEYLRG
jgi:hypothetical protein